jgi:hypothetical protein
MRHNNMNPFKNSSDAVAAASAGTRGSDPDRRRHPEKQGSIVSHGTESSKSRSCGSFSLDDDGTSKNSKKSKATTTTKGTAATACSTVWSSEEVPKEKADSKLTHLLNSIDATMPASTARSNETKTVLSELTTSPLEDVSWMSENAEESPRSFEASGVSAVGSDAVRTTRPAVSHEQQQGTVLILTSDDSTSATKPVAPVNKPIILKLPKRDSEPSLQCRDEATKENGRRSKSQISVVSAEWVPTSPGGHALHKLLAQQEKREKKKRKQKRQESKDQFDEAERLLNSEPTLDMLLGQEMNIHQGCPTVVSGMTSAVLSDKFEPKVVSVSDDEDELGRKERKKERRKSRRCSNKMQEMPGEQIAERSHSCHSRRRISRGDALEVSSSSLEQPSSSLGRSLGSFELSSLSCGHKSSVREDIARHGSSKSVTGRSNCQAKASLEQSLFKLDGTLTIKSPRRQASRGDSVDRSKRSRGPRKSNRSLEPMSCRAESLDRSRSSRGSRKSSSRSLERVMSRGASLDRSRSTHSRKSSHSLERESSQGHSLACPRSSRGLLKSSRSRERTSSQRHTLDRSKSSREALKSSREALKSSRSLERKRSSREIELEKHLLAPHTSDKLEKSSQGLSKKSHSRQRSELSLQCDSRPASLKQNGSASPSMRSMNNGFSSIFLTPLESADEHESLIQWLVEDPNSQSMFLKWLSEKGASSGTEEDRVSEPEDQTTLQVQVLPLDLKNQQSSSQETSERGSSKATASSVVPLQDDTMLCDHSLAASEATPRVQNLYYQYKLRLQEKMTSCDQSHTTSEATPLIQNRAYQPNVGTSVSVSTASRSGGDLSDTTPVARNSFIPRVSEPCVSTLDPLPQESSATVSTPIAATGFEPRASSSSSSEDQAFYPASCDGTPVEAILLGAFPGTSFEYALEDKEFDDPRPAAILSSDIVSVYSEITGLSSPLNGLPFPIVSAPEVQLIDLEPNIGLLTCARVAQIPATPMSGIVEERQQEVQKTSFLSHNSLRSVSISFGMVEVREYERILGDHPACSDGAGIGIDWLYLPSQAYHVDNWEAMRSSSRKGCYILDKQTRENILVELGYDQRHFAQALRESNKIKHQRRQTILNLGAQRVEEAIESCGRKVLKVLLKGGKNTCVV